MTPHLDSRNLRLIIGAHIAPSTLGTDIDNLVTALITYFDSLSASKPNEAEPVAWRWTTKSKRTIDDHRWQYGAFYPGPEWNSEPLYVSQEASEAEVERIAQLTRPLTFSALTMDEHRDLIRTALTAAKTARKM